MSTKKGMKTNNETMTEEEARQLTRARALQTAPPLLAELYQTAEYPAHKPALRAWVTTPLVPLTRTLHEGLETPEDVARALSPDASDRACLGNDGLFSNLVLRGLMFVRDVRRERCPLPIAFAVPSVSARDLAWFSLFCGEALSADPVLKARYEAMKERWSRYFQDKKRRVTATAFRTSAEKADSYLRGAAYEHARLNRDVLRSWAAMTTADHQEIARQVYGNLYADGHLFYVSKAAPKAISPDWHEPRYPLRAGIGEAGYLGAMERELARITERQKGRLSRVQDNWWIEIVAPSDASLPFDNASRSRAAQAPQPAVV